jgi:hypothetical protein
MQPEEKARLVIDEKLEQAGYIVQDVKELNVGAGLGVVVREYQTDSGPTDYLIFIDKKPVGIIEAKAHNKSRYSRHIVPAQRPAGLCFFAEVAERREICSCFCETPVKRSSEMLMF